MFAQCCNQPPAGEEILVGVSFADGRPAVAEEKDVVVIGAGFSGLYMLHKLRELDFSVKVFETGSDVGGTWYWNRYPGCLVDVESRDYQYSFSDELLKEWSWTERFAHQPEVLKYIEYVADKFKLRDGIQFDTKVTSAVYDEDTARWTVTTDRGDTVLAKVVVSAVGCISDPVKLTLPEQESFKGNVYYTAQWPKEGVDFSGQNVAVVGTGSSGVGVIPEIAKAAKKLTVLQRSPAFSLPARNVTLDAKTVEEQKEEFKERHAAALQTGFGIKFQDPTKSALEVTEEERRKEYEFWWEKGGVDLMCSSYNDLVLKDEANETAADFVRSKIRALVKDPAVAELLCPKPGKQIGTKRVCVDSGYYETYNRDNVQLVSVANNPLGKMTPSGLELKDGAAFEFDSVVFATGFDGVTGGLTKIDFRGRNGVGLKESWKDGMSTYLGLGVPGFPNLFTITGPGSPAVHSNMLVSIEQHVDWISDCLVHMRTNSIKSMEAQEEKAKEWIEHTQMVGNFTLFGKTESWYMGDNVEGKPRQFLCYLGVGPYRAKCDEVAKNDYEGFTAVPEAAAQRGA